MSTLQVKHRFCTGAKEVRRCIEATSEVGRHHRIYSSLPGSGTKKEYNGYKTSSMWRGEHTASFFDRRPYVVVWFED